MAQTSTCRGTNTTVAKVGSGLVCTYHQTQVATLYADGKVKLDSGGWLTATTKTRMNQFSNQFCGSRFQVRQRDGAWYVIFRDGKEVEFEDGIVV